MENNIGKIINDAVVEQLRNLGRVNIVIAGKTGVGKSTLVNAIFQGDFAETGHGKPVTQHTKEITKEGIPLHIFDTKGLELAEFGKTLHQLEDLVIDRRKKVDPNEHLHCAWLCISEDSRRVEDAEISLLKMLAKYMPVVVVVTKARDTKGFESFKLKIEELLPDASNIIRVRAISETIDNPNPDATEPLTLQPFGREQLVGWTMNAVPEGQRNAFAAAQKVSLQLKVNRAHVAVASFSTAAAVIVAIPVPFAQAGIIVPIQISMLAGISAIFGLPMETAFLTTVVSSVVTGGGATILGRITANTLLYLVPGVGPILAGVINAGTAATFTTVFGEAYIATLFQLLTMDPNKIPSPTDIAILLKEKLAQLDLSKVFNKA